MSLYLGLMSGTSMDGIDAALLSLPENRLIAACTTPYPAEVLQGLRDLLNTETCSLAGLSQLHVQIGRAFAEAAQVVIEQAQCNPKDIHAIGSHGQTVCHDAFATIPYTLQLGCAHSIALRTGITVVADFRAKDLILQGQGAPFAPLYHQKLFGHSTESIAVVNIGGIANMSYLSPNKSVRGWDIGPGNCLMDAWVLHQQGKAYDKDGQWAGQGQVLDALLASLLSDPFFAQEAPKSIGREYFSLNFLAPHLKAHYKAEDIQATLLALTAHSIAQTVLDLEKIAVLYLCGGGVHNKQLVKQLSHLLPQLTVQSTAVAGVDPDYLEAMLFAWLASQTIEGIAVDFSNITGSVRPQLVGAIYPV